MSNESIPAEHIDDILLQMPKTFQIFVMLWRDAEKAANNYVKNGNVVANYSQYSPNEEKLSDEEFETLRGVLRELEIAILFHLKDNSNNSKELAQKLGVSMKTIKRRYKVLVEHKLIITAPKRGATVTLKGYEFIRAIERDTQKGSMGSEYNDPNVSIDPSVPY